MSALSPDEVSIAYSSGLLLLVAVIVGSMCMCLCCWLSMSNAAETMQACIDDAHSVVS
jgi:hypothetical protein